MKAENGDAGLERYGSKMPLYLQIAQLIRQRIFARRYSGTLPAEAELAKEFGVSSGVIRNALGQLREEGLIMTRHGVGSAIAAVPEQRRVTAAPGDQVQSRMPLPAVAEQLGIPRGVPVLVVRHPDGSEDVYDSLRTLIVF